MGLAIGKRGSTVAKVQKTVDKGVEVIEHSDDPVEFIGNLMAPAKDQEYKNSPKRKWGEDCYS